MCVRMKIYCMVFLSVLWISEICRSEEDMDTCVFHYWKMDWQSAVETCNANDKQLLCYKSKKEIDAITELFKLSISGSADLEMWLSSKNCSHPIKMESCFSLHIRKTSERVWHFFQKDCSNHLPFICCVKDFDLIEHTTSTFVTEGSSSAQSPVSIIAASSLSPSISSASPSTTSIKPNSCWKIQSRGIEWPITSVGELSVQPCPGNSTGNASWKCEGPETGKWSENGPNLKDCRSLDVRNLKEKFGKSPVKECMSMLEDVFRDPSREIFGEDLADVVSLMTSLPERLFTATQSDSSLQRWTATKSMIETSASIVDRVIELHATWKDISEKRRPSVGTDLLSTMDGMGILLADSMSEDINEQSIIGKNMALQVMKTSLGESVHLPQWTVTSQYSHRGNIMLEKGYDSHLNTRDGNISVVFTLYSDMTRILYPQQKKISSPSALNSAVVSATVSQNRKPTSISSRVKILVEHLNPQPNNTACVFWNMDINNWDTEGCSLEGNNGTYSVCVCDHLTNFALLMDYKGVMDDVEQLPFFYITVIGCSLSIICLVFCVAIFSCYSYHSNHSWGLRYVIHRNLCLTLLIANLVLVLGLDKTDDSNVCAVVAGMLHYFFLSAFSWMLLEGVHIYLLLVVVFASRRSHWEKYYLFGYGLPLIIVAITAIVRPTYYGTDEVCWLSAEKGTIWAFMGPIACILLINLAALILAQWKASRISIKDDNAALVKRWLRVTFILFPVLGITWIFGFLYVGKHFEVAGYLFAIFNSLQGFCIFVCHCVMDKKARNMVLASFKKKTASITTASSGIQKRQKGSCNQVSNSSQLGIDHQSSTEKKTGTSFQETCRKNWNTWHKPWSFCFDMPVSENVSHNTQRGHEGPPKPIIVQWNSLKDKPI